MNIGNISSCGTWNSLTDRPNKVLFTEFRDVNFFEFEFIISGDATIYIDESSYPVFPNMLIIAKPGQRRRSMIHFKTYYLHIDIDKTFEYYDIIKNLPDCIYTFTPDTYISFFIDIIPFLIENDKNTDNIYFNSKFLEFIYHLHADSTNSKHIADSTNIYNLLQTVNTVKDYININYKNKITLSDLSKITNYSPNYLQNLFVTATGMSPCEYLTAERIKNAKFLLIHSDMPISDVAYTCGFSSQSYFAKTFKKHLACTPAEYRRIASPLLPEIE